MKHQSVAVKNPPVYCPACGMTRVALECLIPKLSLAQITCQRTECNCVFFMRTSEGTIELPRKKE